MRSACFTSARSYATYSPPRIEHSAVVVRIGRRCDRNEVLPSWRTWPGNRQSTISRSERFTIPFVAAAFSDSDAAAATTNAAGASTSTRRPNTVAKRRGVIESSSKAALEAQADGYVLEADELEALQPLIFDVAGDAVLELRREAARQTPVRVVGVVRLDQHRRP